MMVRTCKFLLLLCAVLPATVDAAGADRESLIDAWIEHMPTASGTIAFEARGDDLFYIEDDNLPYAGELRLIGALVRPAETTGVDLPFTHMGMVEFELVDLPAERLQSQNYYYWLSDRQTLHFSATEQAWVGPSAYRRAIQRMYDTGDSYGPMSFMLNYGIWIVLLALLIWVFAIVNRYNRKARALMDESSSINADARDNIERSAEIQKESIEISRQLLEIQKANGSLLEQIRDKL